MRDALHHAAVAEEHVGVVVDNLVAWAIERRGQYFLGQRHADGVCETLSERTGRRFDADVQIALRMARRCGTLAGEKS